MDEAQAQALLRVRVLRRDGYRCRHRGDRGRPCGKRGPFIGERNGETVTLCLDHHDGTSTNAST